MDLKVLRKANPKTSIGTRWQWPCQCDGEAYPMLTKVQLLFVRAPTDATLRHGLI